MKIPSFPFATLALLFMIVLQGCKKRDVTDYDCFPNASTVRLIEVKPATVKEVAGRFYLIEQGAIDKKLNPCNLTADFQIDNLPVTISGVVKATIPSGPCCTEDFVIKKIAR